MATKLFIGQIIFRPYSMINIKYSDHKIFDSEKQSPFLKGISNCISLSGFKTPRAWLPNHIIANFRIFSGLLRQRLWLTFANFDSPPFRSGLCFYMSEHCPFCECEDLGHPQSPNGTTCNSAGCNEMKPCGKKIFATRIIADFGIFFGLLRQRLWLTFAKAALPERSTELTPKSAWFLSSEAYRRKACRRELTPKSACFPSSVAHQREHLQR